MAYEVLDNFRSGMVRTRARHAGPRGSVWTAADCIINRSGELERRLPFRTHKTLPTAQTFGGYKYNGVIHVFGHEAGVTVPAGVTYHQLQHPFGAPMNDILDIEAFFGSLYVIARYSDGSIHHFFNDVRVTDWDQLTTAYGSFANLATAFAAKINSASLFTATAQGAFLDIEGYGGVEFTLTASVVNGGVSSDQSAVISEIVALGSVVSAVSAEAEFEVVSGTAGTSGQTTGSINVVSASMSCSVQTITVSGNELLDYEVVISEDFNNSDYLRRTLAQAVAASISAHSAVSGWTATFDGTFGVNLVRAGGGFDGVLPSISSIGCNLPPTVLNEDDTPSNYVSSILVDGTAQLLGALVPFGASVNATATAIAAAINAYTPTSGYTASAAGPIVTVVAPPGLGATVNTHAFTFATTGSFVIDNETAFSGGVNGSTSAQQKQRVEFTGVFEVADTWTLTVGGTPYTVSGDAFQPGRQALTFRKKVYSSAGSVVLFSALRDARSFVSGIGAGFLNVSGEKYGDAAISTLAEYAGNMAVFTKQSIAIFDMREDEDLNQLLYTIENIGTNAELSVQPFGQRDVFFLTWGGVRSLRAHNGTDRAFVSDVGTPIDPFVQEWMDTQGATIAAKAKSVIEPKDNRYVISIGTRAFVFNYFPDEKIAGWTYWNLPSEPKAWFRDERILYVRMGDVIYAYGGDNGNTLPEDGEVIATVEMHFVDAKTPMHFKNWDDLDMGLVGEWMVSALIDPNNTSTDDETPLGVFHRITYPEGDRPFDLRGTHIALKLVCSKGGAAKITDMTPHYNGSEDKN
jgi:hypothetical protein